MWGLLWWPSTCEAAMMLALRPSQFRKGSCGLVGLCGAVMGADATRVESVGTALLDFVERCPGRLGGRFWLAISCRSVERRRFLSGD